MIGRVLLIWLGGNVAVALAWVAMVEVGTRMARRRLRRKGGR